MSDHKRLRGRPRQRAALNSLLEDDLQYTPRGFGHRGELPQVRKDTAARLIKEGLARTKRPSGARLPTLTITAEGLRVLRAIVDEEKRLLQIKMDGHITN